MHRKEGLILKYPRWTGIFFCPVTEDPSSAVVHLAIMNMDNIDKKITKLKRQLYKTSNF
ncbi:hypothetical protein CLOHYLEM_05757 [[Clostridium] hylemonae DSM 15053]|uniref:Uncharacterized protein n=1 Tax=[Clostridium] hylemonae DSM 15053 TaxID=553973 RepID=C0C298_9FIRM|nr:hypothetical protein CLOHYLEM_05757 [[Clostridium] hylemonae DSM 15053]